MHIMSLKFYCNISCQKYNDNVDIGILGLCGGLLHITNRKLINVEQ